MTEDGHGTNRRRCLNERSRISRRGVLTAGGAAAVGAATALATTGIARRGDTGSGARDGDQESDDRASSQLTIPVDTLATSDDARIGVINERCKQAAGKDVPVFEFANRVYTISAPIQLYSGLKLLGSAGLPAREYGGGTTIRWDGGPDTSVFHFPEDGQAGQKYPSDGSPRDISISGILFEGGSRTDVFPRLMMTGDDYPGHTLWYCNLHNLGVRGMRSFWWGYGTGVSLTGTFHAQAMSDTPLFIGGSENTIFGAESQSFMDNSSAAWASGNKPFIRLAMSKSHVGRVIITARSDSYHISVEGGRGLFIDGAQFDAPAGSPTYGRAISVLNADGLTISNCSFYSGMENPGENSRGIIDISQGRHIVIQGNQFLGAAGSQPADIPLVVNSGPDPVKFGLNGFPGYTGVVRGNVESVDPGVTVQPL